MTDLPSDDADREEAIFARRAKRDARASELKRKADQLKDEGNAFFRAGNYYQAAEYYQAACREYGPDPVYMSNFAATMLKLQFFDQAERAATLALQYAPKNVKARYRRALARKALKRYQAAIRDLQVLVRNVPACQDAIDELAVLQQQVVHDSDGTQDGNSTSDDENPPFNAPDEEVACDSDSSDFNHKGNGIPCKAYNRNGCGLGAECPFSHGPHSRGVRDSLGKNVCVLYLLNRCPPGDDECPLSHAKENIRHSTGWYNDQQFITRAQVYYDAEMAKGADADITLESILSERFLRL